MKLKPTFIQKYNQPDTLLVISSYPPKGEKYPSSGDALSSFAKNRLDALGQISSHKTVVFTHALNGKIQIYQESPNTLVIRLIKKNKPLSFINLFHAISQFNKATNLLIEYEFSTFGDNQMTVFFPLLLLALRSIGKNISLELHQILLNLEPLSGHLGYSSKDIKTRLLNPIVNIFYKTITTISHHTIVLEQALKTRLEKTTSSDKIHFLPHGVDQAATSLSQKQARKKLKLPLNDFLVLNFGYITWYKGTDLAVNAFNHLKKDSPKTKLILAGGPSYNQKHKKHYQTYYQNTIKKTKNNKNIILTGFIKEKEIPLYFSAVDLVILPYRTFMSSSGPLSLALSYNKPFIISHRLKPYLDSTDIQNSLTKHQLSSADIVFSLSSSAISKHLKMTKNKLTKLSHFSQDLAQKRSYLNLANTHFNLITQSTGIKTILKPSPSSAKLAVWPLKN